ncbi:MAG: UMP kinase [Methanobacteriota archaeon]
MRSDRAERVVLSLGGSILMPTDTPDSTKIREFAEALKSAAGESRRIMVVVGGGSTARNYIRTARGLGADEYLLDEIGIAITRANARLLSAALPDAFPAIPRTVPEAVAAAASHRFVVMGGTEPGHTTDAVAAMLAERSHAARMVNATNVDGVFSEDPRTNPDARLFEKMTINQLVTLAQSQASEAGSSGVFDPLAARILRRARLPLSVVNGKDLKNLANALSGAAFRGTLVTPAGG